MAQVKRGRSVDLRSDRASLASREEGMEYCQASIAQRGQAYDSRRRRPFAVTTVSSRTNEKERPLGRSLWLAASRAGLASDLSPSQSFNPHDSAEFLQLPPAQRRLLNVIGLYADALKPHQPNERYRDKLT